jgi:hypothetical protein
VPAGLASPVSKIAARLGLPRREKGGRSPLGLRAVLSRRRQVPSLWCRSFDDSKSFRRSDPLIAVMNEIRGTVNGWARQYKFCNETNLFSQLDDAIDKKINEFLGAYKIARGKTTRDGKRFLLGIEPISRLARSPFEWPKSPPNIG